MKESNGNHRRSRGGCWLFLWVWFALVVVSSAQDLIPLGGGVVMWNLRGSNDSRLTIERTWTNSVDSISPGFGFIGLEEGESVTIGYPTPSMATNSYDQPLACGENDCENLCAAQYDADAVYFNVQSWDCVCEPGDDEWCYVLYLPTEGGSGSMRVEQTHGRHYAFVAGASFSIGLGGVLFACRDLACRGRHGCTPAAWRTWKTPACKPPRSACRGEARCGLPGPH